MKSVRRGFRFLAASVNYLTKYRQFATVSIGKLGARRQANISAEKREKERKNESWVRLVARNAPKPSRGRLST